MLFAGCRTEAIDDDDTPSPDDDDSAVGDDDSADDDDDSAEPSFGAPCEEADLGLSGPLVDALATLGDDPVVLAIDSPQAVDADLDVPANVDLCFLDGGRLEIADGVTVAIGGRVIADPVQVFAYGGDDAAVTGMVVDMAYPQWWGAVADDDTNDTDALRYTGRWVSTGGGRIEFLPGEYIVGEQTLAGAYGVSTSYPTESILAVTFHEELTVVPTWGWYISVSGVQTTDVVVDGPEILWQWWADGEGYVGNLPDGSW